MSKLHVKVITPERTLVDRDADEVILTTSNGEIAILPHHMALISDVASGDIIVRTGGVDEVAVVHGGFVQVHMNGDVLILADGAEHLHELNEVEIQAAKKRAEEAKEASKGNTNLLAASEAELSRITTQLRSLTKHAGIRRRHSKERKDQ